MKPKSGKYFEHAGISLENSPKKQKAVQQREYIRFFSLISPLEIH